MSTHRPRDENGTVLMCLQLDRMHNVTFTSSGVGTLDGNGERWLVQFSSISTYNSLVTNSTLNHYSLGGEYPASDFWYDKRTAPNCW